MKRITMPGKADDENGKPALKPKVPDQRAQEGQRRFRALRDGVRAIVSEMKRVTWPSRDEWVSATVVTIGLVALVAIWTAAISHIVEFLLSLLKTSGT
jgi:preprotein translocase SecE subunit